MTMYPIVQPVINDVQGLGTNRHFEKEQNKQQAHCKRITPRLEIIYSQEHWNLFITDHLTAKTELDVRKQKFCYLKYADIILQKDRATH